MAKLNTIKVVTFIKSVQLFLYVVLFSFIFCLFITSITGITDQNVFIWNNNQSVTNEYYIGFYRIFINGDSFRWEVSAAFIAYTIIVTLSLGVFIFNMILLKTKYSYVRKTFFYTSLTFLIFSLILLIIIYSVYFSIEFKFESNTNNNWVSLNSIVNYNSFTTTDYTIAKYSFSVGGLVYLSFLSFLFLLYIYFPCKIIYNLVKVRYI